jgi:HSP20 family protein
MPLPAAVRGDDAKASYRNGVLKVELPKMRPGKPTSVNIKVD